jgi:hypothetical protein
MTKFNFDKRPKFYYRSFSMEVEVDWENAVDEAGYENVMYYLHNGQSTAELITFLKSLPQDIKDVIIKELQ